MSINAVPVPHKNFDRLAYRVPEFAEMIGVSKSFLYCEQKRGNLSISKISHRAFISRDEAERYVRVNLGMNLASRAA